MTHNSANVVRQLGCSAIASQMLLSTGSSTSSALYEDADHQEENRRSQYSPAERLIIVIGIGRQSQIEAVCREECMRIRARYEEICGPDLKGDYPNDHAHQEGYHSQQACSVSAPDRHHHSQDDEYESACDTHQCPDEQRPDWYP